LLLTAVNNPHSSTPANRVSREDLARENPSNGAPRGSLNADLLNNVNAVRVAGFHAKVRDV